MTGNAPQNDPQRPRALPIAYTMIWAVLRPFFGMILRHRARRGKEDPQRLDERLGLYQTPPPRGAIWLHAVSVGETVAALALIEALVKQVPTAQFLITTNTVSAANLVRMTAITATITHLYQPLDHPVCVRRFLAATAPRAAVFLESDFWPNLITQAANSHIPVIFASSQLSDTAFSRWRKRPKLAATVFGAADLGLAVNDLQADRLRDLGTAPDKVQVLGSLKVPALLPVDPELTAQLNQAAGNRHVFLAASTHDGEDDTLITAATELGDDWFTIIAPRHPDRGAGIMALCHQRGITAQRRGAAELPSASDRLYIVDTLGEMGSLFSIADAVFLGGSLLPLGGHNPLEPAQFGLAVITGPHIAKNQAEFKSLQALGAVRKAADGPAIAAAARANLADGQTGKTQASARRHAKDAGKRLHIAAGYILALL